MNPYLGHTDEERRRLLEAIGAASLEDLFSQIPEPLRFQGDLDIPPPLGETDLMRLARERAERNLPGTGPASFLGAGCYDHSIPGVVKHLAGRGEFLTAYTPYQPEASQGMLQAIFEYQTMVSELTGLPVANASLYDGSTALAEAALMALGAARNRNRIVVARGVHPHYRETLASFLANLPYEIIEAPETDGRLDAAALGRILDGSVAAVAVQHPNFFGLLEEMPAIRETAAAAGATLIAVCDPVSLGVLAPPGEYGADIAVGEGQPFGLSPYFGGDTVGLFACSEAFMRKAPGRLAGEAMDRRGNMGYVLALQTREQHIRREKATSNICTNQGLNALKAAIALASLGPQGLREMAAQSVRATQCLVRRLEETCGARPAFDAPFFKECPVRFGVEAQALHERLMQEGFLAGLPLGGYREDLSDALLLCATETKTPGDIDAFAEAAGRAVEAMREREPAGAGRRA